MTRRSSVRDFPASSGWRRSVGWLALGLLLIRADGSVAVAVSFRNDVMAVLSKAGCNAGACHGNANGKAGFKLSLRGEAPDLDLLALTRDQFARRTNPLEPDQSLILLKPTTQVAHEGGQRFKKDSDEYAILREWIVAGAPDDPAETRKLVSLEVTPTEKILIEPATEVQLRARARFSDGTTRDVTSLAVYEPANGVATVDHDGLARRETMGETTILVRYLQCQVPVTLAFVPDRPGFQWQNPRPQNYIDEQIFAKLKTRRINPSALCSDEVFARRAYLDLLGVLPTAAEAQAFVVDGGREKRARLVERLFDRPEFADFWALKWSDLLRNEERVLDQKGVQDFHHWIRQSIAENQPLDQFVRELIAARGSTYSHPSANFFRANRDPVARSMAVAQVFLGARLQCAQCHNHPFDRWTQDDYYDWAGLFARVDYKVLENRRQDSNDQHEFKGEQVVYLARQGDVKNSRTGKSARPRFLGVDAPIDGDDQDFLENLAAWMTRAENPWFTRVQVNRIWFNLMGRGIVDPIDDFRATNPPSHPALLDALAKDFVARRFDLRYLIRTIMISRVYQLSSEPNASNAEDEVNFSRNLLRRLTAKQMLDCESEVLGASPKFEGYPVGMRAAQIPGARVETRRGGKSGATDQFLELFGKPPRLLTCECERSNETTMGQAFQMIGGPAVNQLLTTADNRLGRLLAAGKSSREMVEELYWTALTRAPAVSELEKLTTYLDHATDRRQALEDATWSLLNAKEFVFRQ